MDEWILYYNPKCGSCRKALEILKSKGIAPRLIEYLKNPPLVSELTALLKNLRVDPLEMMRAKEPVFDELKLDSGKKKTPELLRAIADHPILLQRPIVVHGSRAVIARPPEKVATLFS